MVVLNRTVHFFSNLIYFSYTVIKDTIFLFLFFFNFNFKFSYFLIPIFRSYIVKGLFCNFKKSAFHLLFSVFKNLFSKTENSYMA